MKPRNQLRLRGFLSSLARSWPVLQATVVEVMRHAHPDRQEDADHLRRQSVVWSAPFPVLAVKA